MSDTTERRQQRAIAAASRIAGRYGIHTHGAMILKDSNHTVIHLAPAPVVAKVGTSPEEASLANEVMVATFLSAVSTPVVPPTPLFPPGPHLEVTFWEYCRHRSSEPSPDVLGRSLQKLHNALTDYPGALRAWDRFDGVDRVLQTPSALQALPPEDQTFLRRKYEETLTRLGCFHPPLRSLHGEPHAANLLLSPQGPRWIDFESACLGPQEWDLTVLPDEVAASYFECVDWDLLRILRSMRSVCVAVWCWLDPDRAPILRQAGMYHLAALRQLDGL